MKKGTLLTLIAGAVAFIAAISLIVVYWDQVTDLIFRIREKIIGVLDSISQRKYVEQYDEYEDSSSWD